MDRRPSRSSHSSKEEVNSEEYCSNHETGSSGSSEQGNTENEEEGMEEEEDDEGEEDEEVEEDGEEDEEEYEQDERDQKEGNDYDTRSEASDSDSESASFTDGSVRSGSGSDASGRQHLVKYLATENSATFENNHFLTMSKVSRGSTSQKDVNYEIP